MQTIHQISLTAMLLLVSLYISEYENIKQSAKRY